MDILMREHYELLGVSSDVDADLLRKAYLREMKQWHPDLNPHDAQAATVKAQKIAEAYQAICICRQPGSDAATSSAASPFRFWSVLDAKASLNLRGRFAQALQEYRLHPQDIAIALKLIHAACRAQAHAHLPAILRTKILIDSSALLVRIVPRSEAIPTLEAWAEYLDHEGHTADAIQLLADGLQECLSFLLAEQGSSDAVQARSGEHSDNLGPAGPHSRCLYHLTYEFCNGRAPKKQPMPPPDVRIKLLRQAIRFYQDLGYLRKMIASALVEAGNLEAAGAEFQEAIRLDPELTGVMKLKRALGLAAVNNRVPTGIKPEKAATSKYVFQTEDQLPSEWALFNAAENAKWDTLTPLLDFDNFSPKIRRASARPLVEQAAWHIGYSGKAIVIPALMELTESVYSDVRHSSRLSLARLGDAGTLQCLMALKPFSSVTLEGDNIKQATGYLEMSLSHRQAPGALVPDRGLFDQAKRFLDNKEAGRARYLLEFLIGESTEIPDTKIEHTKSLSFAAAQMEDYRAASRALIRIYFSLKESDKATLASDLFRWLVLTLPRSYSPEFDLQFGQCLSVGAERIAFASNAEAFLPSVKEFNQFLARLGKAECATRIHRFIQTKAPANDYFYASNCHYYDSDAALSVSLQEAVTKKAEDVTKSVAGRLKAIMRAKPSTPNATGQGSGKLSFGH